MNIAVDFSLGYKNDVPKTATFGGIYVVYALSKSDANSWTLLDIGQAKNIFERHEKHERKPLWLAYAKKYNCDLVYYLAQIDNSNYHRDIAEAALLYKMQPRCATDGKDGYHHGDVTITVKGYLQNAFGTFSLKNTDS